MVLKRSKCNLNSGNSFGRRRFNYLKRMGVAKYGYVVAGATAGSQRRLACARNAMYTLAEQLSLSDVFNVQKGNRSTQDDGTIFLESVPYSLNKSKRWETLGKFVEGVRRDSLESIKCAVSVVAVERTPFSKQSTENATRNTAECVACCNVRVQPLTPQPKRIYQHLWDGRMCPGCNTLVEKISGCNHMRCTACDYNFCWNCMKSLFNHNSPSSRCEAPKLKPIVLQDHREPKLANVLDDIVFHCSTRDYPSFYCRNDLLSASDVDEDSESDCETSAKRRDVKRADRTKIHHNQHFRGVQRPAKVKRESEVSKSKRKRPQKTAEPQVEETEPATRVATNDEDDDEIVRLPPKPVVPNNPHLLYRIDLPKLLSYYNVAQVVANAYTKVGESRLKRASTIQVSEAVAAFRESQQSGDNELYEDEDEDEESNETVKETGASAARENRQFSLLDFVRPPRRNRHASRRSSRTADAESADSQFSIISLNEARQSSPSQVSRAASPFDQFVLVH